MIPAFNPLAGPSPNCWAVRVQIEHWAFVSSEAMLKQKRKKTASNPNLHFIALILGKISPFTINARSHFRNGEAIQRIQGLFQRTGAVQVHQTLFSAGLSGQADIRNRSPIPLNGIFGRKNCYTRERKPRYLLATKSIDSMDLAASR
jgi:hypothetical protein